MGSTALDAFERFHPADRPAWRAWLEAHHRTAKGVWLVTWRKAAVDAVPGRCLLTYDDGVEEALCFGWIDSKPQKLDDERTMLLYTPRKPKSAWSAPNKVRVERLLAAGAMATKGLEMVELARSTGRWTALDAVEALEVPEDLAAALEALPPASAHFAAFPRSAKRGILEWISTAKRPETRAARVLETATLAQRNERANQWKPKPP
jgi:uncharacterized protein YdeI (YjbR/CyaY-like superfamily)